MVALFDTFSIATKEIAASYHDQLRRLFLSEWDELDPFLDDEASFPHPLVMLTSTGDLAGGLSFTRAQSPFSAELAVWVNAVLVLPEYRWQGLATHLLCEAESATRASGIDFLFAYTDKPSLYASIGWSVVKDSGGKCVMMRDLSNAP